VSGGDSRPIIDLGTPRSANRSLPKWYARIMSARLGSGRPPFFAVSSPGTLLGSGSGHSGGRRPAGPLGRIPRSGPGGAEVNPASLDGAPSEEGCRAGGSPPEGDSSSSVDARASRHGGRELGGGVASSPNTLSVGPPAWRRSPRCPRCRRRESPESLGIGLRPFPRCVRGSESSDPDAYPEARDIASFPGELGALPRSCHWGWRVHPGW